MVVVRIDQLQRQHTHAQHFGNLLMAACIAAHSIAGKQCVAAEQGVAGSLERKIARRVERRKCCSSPCRCGCINRANTACLPTMIAALAVNTKSGSPFTGGTSEILAPAPEKICRKSMVDLPLGTHPRIDLILNAIIVRRTHQNMGSVFHTVLSEVPNAAIQNSTFDIIQPSEAKKQKCFTQRRRRTRKKGG